MPLDDDLDTTLESISLLDLGDRPEDGLKSRLPHFTGGDPYLYPDEFSGRYGETMPEIAAKLNGNFQALESFLELYKTEIEETFSIRKAFHVWNENHSNPGTGVISGNVVHINPSNGLCENWNQSMLADGRKPYGLYIFDTEHKIYTHGCVTHSATDLVPGKTYGLTDTSSSVPVILDDSHKYLVDKSIMPIFRAISTNECILVSNTIIDHVVYPSGVAEE